MANYGNVEYWDDRYARDPEPYDWYQRYASLKELLGQNVRKSDTVLVTGCGNSRLSEEMYDDGFSSITNVDYSSPVIDLMRAKHADKKGMSWHVMDVINHINFPDGSFDAVLDKGTLDCVLCGPSSTASAASYCSEVSRLLKLGGIFIVVSFGSPENRLQYLDKEEYKWRVVVHTIPKPTISGAPPLDPADPASNHYIYICKRDR